MAHMMNILQMRECYVRYAWCRYVKCTFGKNQDKSTQVRRGGAHNCRIDETVVLDVTGDQQTGQLLATPLFFLYVVKAGFLAPVSGKL